MPEQLGRGERGRRAPEHYLISRSMSHRFQLREQQLALVMGEEAARATMRAWISQYGFWHVGAVVLVTGVWARMSNLPPIWIAFGLSVALWMAVLLKIILRFRNASRVAARALSERYERRIAPRGPLPNIPAVRRALRLSGVAEDDLPPLV
jgi:hypothetical protein